VAAALKLSYCDYSNEVAWCGFTGETFTAANHDAQVALQATLVAALEDIILGNNYKLERVANVILGTRTPAATKQAQRECKWRVSYEDTTTHVVYSLDLPMADLTLTSTNSDEADPADAAIIAFTAAFEAYVLSPAGHAVNILGIKHVGRRD
jgi:hypothetical protein